MGKRVQLSAGSVSEAHAVRVHRTNVDVCPEGHERVLSFVKSSSPALVSRIFGKQSIIHIAFRGHYKAVL